jgi:uncharacterized protein (TIGR03118 family)
MRKVLTVAGFIAAAHITFAASTYTVHNLISDIPNPGGTPDPNVIIDPNLVDPWGIAISASSPFWVSDAGTGKATVYSWSATTGAISVASRVVNVPSASGGPARVTGQIFGPGAGNFQVGSPAANSSFIFCTEDGTISGWAAAADPNNAIITANNNGQAVYKGCAVASTPQGMILYAANFSAGTVDVFDSKWNPMTVSGGFVDPSATPGLNPFNVWVLGNKVFVTYAVLGPDGVSDQPGRGNGKVNIFDYNGNFIGSVSDPSLNSPWGLEIAPEFFGDYSFALLVGNFGDGHINAFDPLTGAYLGTLSDSTGKPLVLEGLWGLQFGNGKSGGDAKTLYFAAGISGGGHKEAHGLLGAITTP